MNPNTLIAHSPFNMKSWGGEHLREDKRWKYGVPPAGNANFAWVQHMIHHLAPVQKKTHQDNKILLYG